jgi:di/tricarboxylate transporter
MIPVVLQISYELNIDLNPLIWALAFGACLGGNGTLIGASANVVTAGMSEEAGYPISFNEFFKAGFPIMILTTAIISFYMMLVYVVGADGGATTWKLVLVGLTMFGIIFQVARGRAKGKSFADSLVDDDSQEIKEFVDSIVDKVTNRSNESEE